MNNLACGGTFFLTMSSVNLQNQARTPAQKSLLIMPCPCLLYGPWPFATCRNLHSHPKRNVGSFPGNRQSITIRRSQRFISLSLCFYGKQKHCCWFGRLKPDSIEFFESVKVFAAINEWKRNEVFQWMLWCHH